MFNRDKYDKIGLCKTVWMEQLAVSACELFG